MGAVQGVDRTRCPMRSPGVFSFRFRVATSARNSTVPGASTRPNPPERTYQNQVTLFLPFIVGHSYLTLDNPSIGTGDNKLMSPGAGPGRRSGDGPGACGRFKTPASAQAICGVVVTNAPPPSSLKSQVRSHDPNDTRLVIRLGHYFPSPLCICCSSTPDSFGTGVTLLLRLS